MDKSILDKIYAKIGEDFIDQMEIERATREETDALLEMLECYVSSKEYRKAESNILTAIGIAEEKAFISGIKFTIKALLECLS